MLKVDRILNKLIAQNKLNGRKSWTHDELKEILGDDYDSTNISKYFHRAAFVTREFSVISKFGAKRNKNITRPKIRPGDLTTESESFSNYKYVSEASKQAAIDFKMHTIEGLNTAFIYALESTNRDAELINEQISIARAERLEILNEIKEFKSIIASGQYTTKKTVKDELGAFNEKNYLQMIANNQVALDKIDKNIIKLLEMQSNLRDTWRKPIIAAGLGVIEATAENDILRVGGDE